MQLPYQIISTNAHKNLFYYFKHLETIRKRGLSTIGSLLYCLEIEAEYKLLFEVDEAMLSCRRHVKSIPLITRDYHRGGEEAYHKIITNPASKYLCSLVFNSLNQFYVN